VAPSAIDIHATANFIRDLLLAGKIRARDADWRCSPTGSDSSMPVYQPLERFLQLAQLAFLTRLGIRRLRQSRRDRVGIFELDASMSAAERQAFMPIVEWVDGEQKPRSTPRSSSSRACGTKSRRASAGSKGTAAPVHAARARISHGYIAGLAGSAERFTHSRFVRRASCCGRLRRSPTGTDHAAGSGFRPQDRTGEGPTPPWRSSVATDGFFGNPQVKSRCLIR